MPAARSLSFGSHLSVAGGLTNALDEARRLGMECVQIFTRNQRQWKAAPIGDDERSAWLEALEAMGWNDGARDRVISHNSYLVNVASPDPDLAERSRLAQRAELERCERLEIPLCVMHPGAHLGEAPPRSRVRAGEPAVRPSGDPTPDEREGLRRVARALDRIHRDLPGARVLTLLETTAGSGTALGYDFAHLALIREAVREPERVAFCFDTCHVVAAGYEMSTPEAATHTWQQWDALCGRASIRAFHLNDSVGACGSRVDRHAHIGEGACGAACFRSILNHRPFDPVPKVLETPKGEDERGRNLDQVNMSRLRRLAGSRSRGGARRA